MPARAASDFSLVILPDQGENAIYNFVNSATSSVNVTIYELNDTTLVNDLVAREKAGVDVRVILDQAEKSYNTAAYNALTAGGVGVVWSSTAFTYTHQKTITVNDDESYISTGNFDTTYYATSRDYGVFDTDANDVAAIVAVFNADYAHTSITPSDGDDLVWSPDRLADPAPQPDQRGDQEPRHRGGGVQRHRRRERDRRGREARRDRPHGPRRPLGLLIRGQRHRGGGRRR